MRYHPDFGLEILRKAKKYIRKISGVQVEIRTEHLPKKNNI